ncbi:ribosomal protein S18-alanine N-acetyltransferase [Nioella ostreopsis]|uniref:ribosomal protein S18-alanine N-acetyltransferase n=1 Tax=Nioella ostreopsis TaxID=2448479 RepID=UPI000FD9F4B3|nr:ribosomal protein S18-alanine N-acetyltransferase [Nioella ostreopsis]
MTPTDLARIHAASFTTPRPWSAAELESFLSDPLCDLIEGDGGFALIRTIAGEAELLTIAVEPDQRRHGRGKAILLQALDRARTREAEQIFLEVAADNQPAIRLYETTGFVRTGQRPQYYRKPDGTRVDAWLMALPLQACTG